ncbi:hypothetical protein [Flavobacterium sp. 3HN19-14]|uniref:hypothetical protein n=1 Tax=Flavobacterium sp. 3HN19-14 TaxID=3448133 RepID=UPI003EE00690
MVEKIRGVLRLQVIVDIDGSSCLISVENKTNIKTSKLDLKTNVDKNLIWGKQAEKISPLIVLNFTGDNVVVTRFGLGKQGIHELKQ